MDTNTLSNGDEGINIHTRPFKIKIFNMLAHSTRWRKHEHDGKRKRRYKNAQLAFKEMKTRVFEINKKRKSWVGLMDD